MLLNQDEIRARLGAAHALDPAEPGGTGGEPYVEAMRGVIPHAEALGDPDLLMEARLGFTWAMRSKGLEHGPQEFFREVLPVLRRCLLDWHAAPHRYRESLVLAMWDQFLLICDLYISHYPEPAQRVHRLLDELERHCPVSRRWTRYALDHYRMTVEGRRGNRDAVERLWRRLRAQGEPEEHFHLDDKTRHEAFLWQRLGRDDRAVEAAAPMLAGQIAARDGKDHSDVVLMPYLRMGRLDEAVAAHQHGYTRRRMKLQEFGAHLLFCACTGNEERGLDVLHRNIGNFGKRVTTVEWMWAATAAALLCRRVMEKDLDRQWIWNCECDDPECDSIAVLSYAGLGARLRWEALDLSFELDEMDATTFASEKVAEILRTEPIVESLPLPADAAEPRHRATPPPAAHLPDVPDLRRALDQARMLEHPRDRVVRTQRLLQTALARDETDVQPDIRLALLDELMAPEMHTWRRQLFATLAELARLLDARSSSLGSTGLDRIWRAVPAALDRALTYPTVHAEQIRGLLRTLEPHCRPGTGDLHHVRWFGVELEVRRGDLDSVRHAWSAFEALPPAGTYRTRPSMLRSVRWWLDLGEDDAAFEAMAPLLAPLLAGGTPGEDREDYLLPAYLRAGRPGRAREVHERTYRTAREAPEVAAHLDFCARTGELEHGREILHRSLDLYHTARDDGDCSIDRVRAYGAALRLSERIVEAGLDETWTWPADACCAAEDDWTHTRFAASCRTEGGLFVTRWDELMGTHATRTMAMGSDRLPGEVE